MNKTEELKKEIENARINRNISLSEDLWQRYLKGEVDLMQHSFDDVMNLIKTTSKIEVLRAELKSRTEVLKEVLEIMDKYIDFDYGKGGGHPFLIKEERDARDFIKELKAKLEEMK